MVIVCSLQNIYGQDEKLHLVINDSIHTNEIKNFSLDTCGHMLTCSMDKTAKLWNVGTGKLLDTFRVPIGHLDGSLYACAISPDGKTIALAGYTCYEWEKSVSIYIYDVKSNKMKVRISGINAKKIEFLKFIPNTNKLMAITHVGKNILIYETQTWSLIQNIPTKKKISDMLFSPEDEYIIQLSGFKLHSQNKQNSKIKSEELALRYNSVKQNISDTKYYPFFNLLSVAVPTFLASRKFYFPQLKFIQSWHPEKMKDSECICLDNPGILWNSNEIFYIAGKKGPSFIIRNNYVGGDGMSFHTPAYIKACNATSDDKYLVLSLYDHTIRWYNIAEKREALALYFREKEWIVWNPQGYYDCSEGAEKYLGFHFNNGRSKEPSFYPAQSYYRKLFTPDLAKRILVDNEKFPDFILSNNNPTIKIINEQLKGDSLFIDFEVTDENLSIKELDITVNEKKYNNKGIVIAEKPYRNMTLYSCNIPMISGKNEIKITAYNQQDIASERLMRTVDVNPDSIKPALYLFSVGINNSSSPYFGELSYAAKDARDVFDAIIKGTNTLYSRIDTICLENPAKYEIESYMTEISRKARAKDVFIFYFAGHGKEAESNNNKLDYFLITKDTDGDDYQSLHKNALSFQQLCEFSTRIFAQKQLIILDACRSGTAINIMDGGIKVRGGDDHHTVMKKLIHSTGIHLIAASLFNQNAVETHKDGHGIFTAALLNALSGKDIHLKDNTYVSALQIRNYVNDKVAEIVQENGYKAQYPVGYSVNQDFPVVWIKKK